MTSLGCDYSDPFRSHNQLTSSINNSKAIQNNIPSPHTQDSASMSTVQDDDDFKNIDRSSSFQTSTTSSVHNRNAPVHTTNGINTKYDLSLTGNSPSVSSSAGLDISSIGFYSGPSSNHSTLNNIKNASYIKNSLIVPASLNSMKSALTNDSKTNKATTITANSITEEKENEIENEFKTVKLAAEVPTQPMGMKNSPSIQALDDILNNKIKKKSDNGFNSILEDDDEDDGDEDGDEHLSSNYQDFLNQSTSGGFIVTGLAYNTFNNQSRSTFYTAQSFETLDAADYSGFTQEGVEVNGNGYVPDLISLSSTVKSNDQQKQDDATPTPKQQHIWQPLHDQQPTETTTTGHMEYSTIDHDNSFSYVVGDDQYHPDQMTPTLFSPAMVFNEPIQTFEILNPDSIPNSISQRYLYEPYQLQNQTDLEALGGLPAPSFSKSDSTGQFSASVQEIGYEEGESALVDMNTPKLNPKELTQNTSDLEFIRSHHPTYSMRLVRDSTIDDVKEEISPSVAQRQSFSNSTGSPLIDMDSPLLNPFGPNTPRVSASSPSLSLNLQRQSASTPDLQQPSLMMKNSSPLQTFDNNPKIPDTTPQLQQSEFKTISRSKSLPLSPSAENDDDAHQPETSIKSKRLAFKGLFKNNKKSAVTITVASKQVNQETDKKSLPPTPNVTVPSPALSTGSFASRHSKSKSFSDFEGIAQQKPKEEKVKERKEKGRSLLSGWKRKSISFGQPLDEITNKDTNKADNDAKSKRRSRLFGKSKSMDQVTKSTTTKIKTAKKTEESKAPRISVSSVKKKDNDNSTIIPPTLKKPLLETYGFSGSEGATDAGAILSTPSQSPFEFSAPTTPLSINNLELLKTPTYKSPNAARKSTYHEKTNSLIEVSSTEIKAEQSDSNSPYTDNNLIVTPKYTESPFDNYEIQLDGLTPSPKKQETPRFRSLAPQRTPSMPAAGLGIANSGITDEVDEYERKLLSFSSVRTTPSLLSSPNKLNAGEALFPKHLAADEVQSIVSFERSRSMRSTCRNSGSTHKRNSSIVEMVNNNDSEFDQLITADGMVVVRSPKGNSSFKHYNPSPVKSNRSSSKRNSGILKNSPLSSPIKKKFSNSNSDALSKHAIYNDTDSIDFSNGLDKGALNDIYNMIQFGNDDEFVIDTEFRLDDSVQFENSELTGSTTVDEPVNKGYQLEPSPLPHLPAATSTDSENEDGFDQDYNDDYDAVTGPAAKWKAYAGEVDQQHPWKSIHESKNFISPPRYPTSSTTNDIDSLNSPTSLVPAIEEQNYFEAPPRIQENDVSPTINAFMPQFESTAQSVPDTLVRPISMSFKGLRGPSFNSALKPATRSAIIGSLQHTGSHTSLIMPQSESDNSLSFVSPVDEKFGKDYNFFDEPSKDFEDYINVDGEDNDEEIFTASTIHHATIEEKSFPSVVEDAAKVKKSRRQSLMNKLNTSKSSKTVEDESTYQLTTISPSDNSKKNRNKSQTSLSKLSLFGSRGSVDSKELLNVAEQQKKNMEPLKVRFSSRIVLCDTYDEDEYDRHPDSATCNNLTPQLAMMIKNELNEFKAVMPIHDSSRCYTHFF